MSSADPLYLSIVIPAYKESGKIERDIREAAKFLHDNRVSGEIIVVDDGSPDDTAERAARVTRCGSASVTPVAGMFCLRTRGCACRTRSRAWA